MIGRVILNRLGVIVLLLGLGSAAAFYWAGQIRLAQRSNPQDGAEAAGGWKDSSLPSEDTKRFSRDVEINFGKVGVLVAECQVWWENLEPYTRLAIVTAMISGVTAIGCFLVARYIVPC